MVYRGPIDLAYMFGGSLPVKMRRELEGGLVRLYHRRLLEKGVTGYSFEECWQDYLVGALLYAYIPPLAFASLDTSDKRGKGLGAVLARRHFTSIVDNRATDLLPGL